LGLFPLVFEGQPECIISGYPVIPWFYLHFVQMNSFEVFWKKARGLMSRYVIENRISKPEEIKAFNVENYSFESSLSTADEFVFVR